MKYNIMDVYEEFCYKSRKTGSYLTAPDVMEDLKKFIENCFKKSDFKLLKWFMSCFSDADALALARYIVHDTKKEGYLFNSNRDITRLIPLMAVLNRVIKVRKLYESNKYSEEIKTFIITNIAYNLNVIFMSYELATQMKKHPFCEVQTSIDMELFGANDGMVYLGELITYYMHGLEKLFDNNRISIDYPIDFKEVGDKTICDTVKTEDLIVHLEPYPRIKENHILLNNGNTTCFFIDELFGNTTYAKNLPILLLSKLFITSRNGEVVIDINSQKTAVNGKEHHVLLTNDLLSGCNYTCGFTCDEVKKFVDFGLKYNEYSDLLNNKGVNDDLYSSVYIMCIMTKAVILGKKEVNRFINYINNLNDFIPHNKIKGMLS